MTETEKYIAQFPEDVRDILNEIWQIILEEAPEATEKIAYGMPGFYLNKKPMVYFAAYKNHIGFYATPTGHEEFKKELSVYKQGKGSVQFPIKDEIPYQLIRKIVKFRKNKSQKS